MEKKSFLWEDSRAKSAQREAGQEKTVIPVVQEELKVDKREVVAGATRVTKVVSEREETVDMPLLEEEVRVERVPVNAVIDAPVGIRQEGDVTVIPLIEEVLVVEKKLLLREEVRISKEQRTVPKPHKEILRSEHAVVQHVDEPESSEK